MTRQPGCHDFLSSSVTLAHVKFSPSSSASVSPTVIHRSVSNGFSPTSSVGLMGICLSIIHKTEYWNPVLYKPERGPIYLHCLTDIYKHRTAETYNEERATPCESLPFFNTEAKEAKIPTSQEEVGSIGAFPLTGGTGRIGKDFATYISRWDFWAWLVVGPTQALQLCPGILRGRPNSRMRQEMYSRDTNL